MTAHSQRPHDRNPNTPQAGGIALTHIDIKDPS